MTTMSLYVTMLITHEHRPAAAEFFVAIIYMQSIVSAKLRGNGILRQTYISLEVLKSKVLPHIAPVYIRHAVTVDILCA